MAIFIENPPGFGAGATGVGTAAAAGAHSLHSNEVRRQQTVAKGMEITQALRLLVFLRRFPIDMDLALVQLQVQVQGRRWVQCTVYEYSVQCIGKVYSVWVQCIVYEYSVQCMGTVYSV